MRCISRGMLSRTPLLIALVWILLPGGLALSRSSSAQDAEEASPVEIDPGSPDSDVEEIVIMGENTPVLGAEQTVSATTFDPETLEAMGVQDISDLAAQHTSACCEPSSEASMSARHSRESSTRV